jgi:hypothetical protein
LTETLLQDSDDVAVLTACLPWQKSFEQHDPSGNALHSVFTYYLLEGLALKAYEGRKRYVTLKDLYHYVDDKVKLWMMRNVRQGPLQTPSLRGTHAHSVILSGDRRSARVDVDREETHGDNSPSSLEVSVWAQAASTVDAGGKRRLHAIPRQVSAEFKVGERIRIGLRVSHDAFVYLLDAETGGKVAQVFPSGLWRENRLRGGEPLLLPKDEDTFDLAVKPPPGVETLIAVATLHPAPILAEWDRAIEVLPLSDRPLSERDLIRVAEALSRLPRRQWALGQCQFLVRK